MATTIRDNSYTAKPQLAAYRYDQLNRIKQMQTYQSISNNAWGATSTNAYKEVYSYDANGNIKTLERYDGAATPVKIDGLTYGYNLDGNGKLVNNRLRHVKDAQSALLCNYDIDNQNDDNYLYDAIGNLTKDNAEGIDNIEWNAYGKIKSITRAPGVQKSNLEFIYDAMGNRVCKIEKPYNVTSTGWLYTFYVRDASGNIMSTYKKTGDQIEDAVITLDEVMLYGSSRLGVRMVNKTIAQLEAETSLYLFNRRLGLKRYEMSNHLGNILTTFTDRKQQVQSSGVVIGYKTYITSALDYYAFGMGMNERSWNASSYRFGFNGQEKVDEISGTGNHTTALFWEYDPRTGRRWNQDPKPQIGISDYATFGNNPILYADPLGDKIKGKTKEDAQKTKDEMANSLGNQGKEFVEKFFSTNSDNELTYNYDKKLEMNLWMYKKGKYKNREGEKFTSEQAALANGYLMMVRNKKYTVEVSFDDSYHGSYAEPIDNDKKIISVVIGYLKPEDQYLDVKKNMQPFNVTQAFVHEVLGEAFSFSNFNNIMTIAEEKGKCKTSIDIMNNLLLRQHALHCIQVENLFNSIDRQGVDHIPEVNPRDYKKVGLIPSIFQSTFNEQNIK